MAQIQEIILLNQSNKSDEFLKSIGKNTTLFIVIGNILVIASTFLVFCKKLKIITVKALTIVWLKIAINKQSKTWKKR